MRGDEQDILYADGGSLSRNWQWAEGGEADVDNYRRVRGTILLSGGMCLFSTFVAKAKRIEEHTLSSADFSRYVSHHIYLSNQFCPRVSETGMNSLVDLFLQIGKLFPRILQISNQLLIFTKIRDFLHARKNSARGKKSLLA